MNCLNVFILLVQPRHFFLGVLMQYFYYYEPGIVRWYDSMRCLSRVQNSQEWVILTQRRSNLFYVQRNNFAPLRKQFYRIPALSNGYFLLGSFFTDAMSWKAAKIRPAMMSEGPTKESNCSGCNSRGNVKGSKPIEYDLSIEWHTECLTCWQNIVTKEMMNTSKTFPPMTF